MIEGSFDEHLVGFNVKSSLMSSLALLPIMNCCDYIKGTWTLMKSWMHFTYRSLLQSRLDRLIVVWWYWPAYISIPRNPMCVHRAMWLYSFDTLPSFSLRRPAAATEQFYRGLHRGWCDFRRTIGFVWAMVGSRVRRPIAWDKEEQTL